jgi:hypothetical protein
MSLKHAISALAVLALTVAAAADASAQYRNDRSILDRQRQVHQVQQPARHVGPYAQAIRTVPRAQATRTAPGVQQARPTPPRVQAAKPAPVVQPESPPVVVAPKPVAKPTPPLTEEQIAAKAAVDDLLSRDPALLAARELPDPRLIRAAAAKHDADERKAALLKAKREADEAKRRELTERKAREDARLAALKARPEAQAKPAKAKIDTPPPRPDANRASVSPMHPVAVRPVVRMPAPDGAPLARNL